MYAVAEACPGALAGPVVLVLQPGHELHQGDEPLARGGEAVPVGPQQDLAGVGLEPAEHGAQEVLVQRGVRLVGRQLPGQVLQQGGAACRRKAQVAGERQQLAQHGFVERTRALHGQSLVQRGQAVRARHLPQAQGQPLPVVQRPLPGALDQLEQRAHVPPGGPLRVFQFDANPLEQGPPGVRLLFGRGGGLVGAAPPIREPGLAGPRAGRGRGVSLQHEPGAQRWPGLVEPTLRHLREQLLQRGLQPVVLAEAPGECLGEPQGALRDQGIVLADARQAEPGELLQQGAARVAPQRCGRQVLDLVLDGAELDVGVLAPVDGAHQGAEHRARGGIGLVGVAGRGPALAGQPRDGGQDALPLGLQRRMGQQGGEPVGVERQQAAVQREVLGAAQHRIQQLLHLLHLPALGPGVADGDERVDLAGAGRVSE